MVSGNKTDNTVATSVSEYHVHVCDIVLKPNCEQVFLFFCCNKEMATWDISQLNIKYFCQNGIFFVCKEHTQQNTAAS